MQHTFVPISTLWSYIRRRLENAHMQTTYIIYVAHICGNILTLFTCKTRVLPTCSEYICKMHIWVHMCSLHISCIRCYMCAAICFSLQISFLDSCKLFEPKLNGSTIMGYLSILLKSTQVTQMWGIFGHTAIEQLILAIS